MPVAIEPVELPPATVSPELPLPGTTPEWERIEGTPVPLGVSWLEAEQQYNFALYSKHAHRVQLRLYREQELTTPHLTFDFCHLQNKSGPIWHCRLSREQVGDAKYYAYRVDGPAPEVGFAWHHFDSQKLLLDPYARGVYFPPTFDRDAARGSGSNEGHAPLGVIRACHPLPRTTPHRRVRHGSDLVIYELHVRGFTRHPSSGVDPAHRGKYAGVSDKIPYLQQLGVTAVELMPVFQFDHTPDDYWGYMPLNFFTPHDAYSQRPGTCEQLQEFRDMVDALHAAGIEVFLDVVYNHTCEADALGPTYSFRGLDNSTYYLIAPSPTPHYANFSGTGNTLHTANRAVRRLILDSLRYWARDMKIDGFRFDLASIFSRNSDGSINFTDPPIFSQIAGDPDLQHVRLIAEPWDASGLDQLGRRFPGTLWMQWNARYRDALPRFLRGDPGLVGEVMTRLYGSSDLFPDDLLHALRPFESVNYITSHDGFTLYDLVSYTQKRNWANGEDNRDGSNGPSFNCGWEGDDGVPNEVLALRKQHVKNFCALLMLSNGTPMFRMGDEFLQTQGGNNNPYNQDNETSWLDWRRLEAHRDIFRFFREMIALRKAHPTLGRSRFWRDDVRWFGTARAVDLSPGSRCLALFLCGKSQQDDDLYLMINAGQKPEEFGIHEGRPGDWRRIIDTARPSPEDIVDAATQPPLADPSYTVAPHSVVVLLRPRGIVE